MKTYIENKMNIYKFLNSRDIAAHLREINYEFSALECAWLVWQSKNATLKEKHAAWREIMDTMPDMSVTTYRGRIRFESLHIFLKTYMRIESELCELFYRQTHNTAYTYDVYYSYECDWENMQSQLCSSAETCIEKALIGDETPDRIMVRKHWIDDEKCISATFAADRRLLSIESDGILSKAEGEIYGDIFPDIWLSFPTPFQEGDLLAASCDPLRSLPTAECRMPFVLTHLCTWDDREGYDSSDMTAYGYFPAADASIVYHECLHQYMNCEYLRCELKGAERILISISRYLKGEIDLSLLLGAQRIMLCENKISVQRRMLHYTQEELRLAGLETRQT